MRVLLNMMSWQYLLFIRILTFKMSLASFTRSQSLSEKINADHWICFTTWPKWRMVVMCPYIVSANCRKRLIACNVLCHVMSDPITIETDALLTWHSLCDCFSIRYADPHQILLWSGILSGSRILHWSWSFWKYSMRWPEAWILIAMVRMAAMTSREPPTMRLSGNEGSYSQIAVMVSTAATFMIWPITATSARLMTWAKHLIELVRCLHRT